MNNLTKLNSKYNVEKLPLEILVKIAENCDYETTLTFLETNKLINNLINKYVDLDEKYYQEYGYEDDEYHHLENYNLANNEFIDIEYHDLDNDHSDDSDNYDFEDDDFECMDYSDAYQYRYDEYDINYDEHASFGYHHHFDFGQQIHDW